MRPLDSVRSLSSLPPRKAIVLTVAAVLLAAADWLPENSYVDPDRLEFALTVALALTAIAVGVRDPIDFRTAVRWRNRILLLIFTFALMLPAAEFATRLLFKDVTTSADSGGYFSRRWGRIDAFRLNAAGFRERDFTDAKAPGTYRIAVVGDSFTYGNGIRQQYRYSDVLQAHLPAHIEVLNFGLAGANTPAHRRTIDRLLPNIHPDFVLLQWYINDVEDDDSSGRPTFRRLLPFRSLHEWLSVNSALYTVTNMKWAELQILAGMTVSYDAYLKRRLGDPDSRDSRRDRQLLTELIAMCKRHGVPIGIVLFPDTTASLGDDYPFGYLHQRVLDVCNAQSITCLDLRRDFSLVKQRQSLWANRLDHHPSARANAIAAERILETYSKTWVASPMR